MPPIGRKAGRWVPPLALLPNGPAIGEGQATPGISTDPTVDPPSWPRGAVPGGAKKWPKLSRLGELLNTQKNVHFFAPRGALLLRRRRPGLPDGALCELRGLAGRIGAGVVWAGG